MKRKMKIGRGISELKIYVVHDPEVSLVLPYLGKLAQILER